MVFKISERLAGRGWMAGAVAAAVVLRVLALPGALDGTDPVNFALALEHFDLARHQPHFPGYPVYVLVGRAFAGLGDPVLALALPGILGAVLMVLALHRAVAARANGRAADLAAWLAAVAPPLVEAGALPRSDGLGLALAGCAFAAAVAARRPRHHALAGLLLGVALGVRPSLATLALSLALFALLFHDSWRAAAVALGGVAVGALAWAVPLVLLVGPREIAHLGAAHVAGHFARWGGAATVDPDVAARALTLGTHLLALAPAVAVALAVRARGDRLAVSVAAAAIPWAAWTWLAQDVTEARHAAPLVLLVAVAAGCALAHARRPVAAIAVAVAAAFTVAGPIRSRAHATERADAARWIAAHLGAERVVVAGTHLPRVASFYAPTLRTAHARDAADLARLAADLDGVIVVVSSEIAGIEGIHRPVARFGALTIFTVIR